MGWQMFSERSFQLTKKYLHTYPPAYILSYLPPLENTLEERSRDFFIWSQWWGDMTYLHTKLYSSKLQKPKIPICIFSNCIFRSIHAAYASSKLCEFLVLVYNGHNGHNGYNGYNWYNCIIMWTPFHKSQTLFLSSHHFSPHCQH